jgi:hypothetical protein
MKKDGRPTIDYFVTHQEKFRIVATMEIDEGKEIATLSTK